METSMPAYRLQFSGSPIEPAPILAVDTLTALTMAYDLATDVPADLYQDHQRVCTISRDAVTNWRPGWMTG